MGVETQKVGTNHGWKKNSRNTPRMNAKEFNQIVKEAGFGSKVLAELNEGTKKRKAAAKKCAELDHRTTTMSYPNLLALYEEGFMEMATDEMVESVLKLRPYQRWTLFRTITQVTPEKLSSIPAKRRQ